MDRTLGWRDLHQRVASLTTLSKSSRTFPCLGEDVAVGGTAKYLNSKGHVQEEVQEQEKVQPGFLHVKCEMSIRH